MKRFIIVIIILAYAIIANISLSRSEISVRRTSLELLPKSLGGWQVIDEQTIDNTSMAVLMVDDYIMRSYFNNQNNQIIKLYIGYFKSQREGKQIHSPRQCLPGAGYLVEGTEVHQLRLHNDSHRTVPVNLYIMRRGNDRQLFLWWYQGRGRIYASEYLNKYYQVIDAIKSRRTDGALIRVEMHVEHDTDITKNTLIDFVQYLIPLLHQYIPD